MLVGVGHQGQEARALDGGGDLTLVNGASTGQTGRNDLAVFCDEITQGVGVFIVNFFDTGHCEAAETLALEQQ